MIKTFRGLLTDGAQDTIVLHTNDGSIGYRIVKFQIMGNNPGSTGYEHIVKIYKTAQTGATTETIDFSDQTLLAAAFLQEHDSNAYVSSHEVIFDQEIFNQDIYITHKDTEGALAVNYYIELEQIKLDLSESTVATLKDIRNELRIAPG